ncbi:hypothetical protein GWI33_012398, partial [Rhynchophorus ferrugineus]
QKRIPERVRDSPRGFARKGAPECNLEYSAADRKIDVAAGSVFGAPLKTHIYANSGSASARTPPHSSRCFPVPLVLQQMY